MLLCQTFFSGLFPIQWQEQAAAAGNTYELYPDITTKTATATNYKELFYKISNLKNGLLYTHDTI